MTLWLSESSRKPPKPRQKPWEQAALCRRMQKTKDNPLLPALRALVEARTEKKIRRVLTWQEETRDGGFCETCWFEETVVTIWFKNWEGVTETLTVYSTLAELVCELSRVPASA